MAYYIIAGLDKELDTASFNICFSPKMLIMQMHLELYIVKRRLKYRATDKLSELNRRGKMKFFLLCLTLKKAILFMVISTQKQCKITVKILSIQDQLS